MSTKSTGPVNNQKGFFQKVKQTLNDILEGTKDDVQEVKENTGDKFEDIKDNAVPNKAAKRKVSNSIGELKKKKAIVTHDAKKQASKLKTKATTQTPADTQTQVAKVSKAVLAVKAGANTAKKSNSAGTGRKKQSDS